MKIYWKNFIKGDALELNGRAHLWEISTGNSYEPFLSEAERLGVGKIGDSVRRRQHEAAAGGLRMIVSLYKGLSHDEVSFLRAERGKPYVENGPHFNLSHTLDRIFVIISQEEIGLDVEGSSRRVMARELAAKFFSEEECLHLGTLPDDEAQETFLRYWVCKEAMVKLSGDGIYHGLRDARVIVSEDGTRRGDYRGRAVCLWEFSPAPGFVAAVATWKRVDVKTFFRL